MGPESKKEHTPKPHIYVDIAPVKMSLFVAEVAFFFKTHKLLLF